MSSMIKIREFISCGRANGRDIVVDGMLRQTAGKSICYAGKLEFPEPHAVVVVVSSPHQSPVFHE